MGEAVLIIWLFHIAFIQPDEVVITMCIINESSGYVI